MAKTIIKAGNVSKRYILGTKEHSFSIKESILGIFKKQSKKLFWSLKDINFEVKEGEVMGIIGANGAGKSTMLKILSQITPPTTGKISIRGQVASLLEVGTGFHPEFTGRENIYLNGAILGMTHKEIKSKFDAIVDFSGVEKFLDTPVKRYSSGMYVRLAFAVAAHLEPDILLVDEVLSVGDFQFQKKSLGKMNDMSKKGRTVIFVSHNMPMIELLCDRAMLLDHGIIRDIGPTSQIVQMYYGGTKTSKKKVDYSKRTVGDDVARILRAKVMNNKGKEMIIFKPQDEIVVEMEYRLLKNDARVSPNFHFYTSEGVCAFVSSDVGIDPKAELKRSAGTYLARCIIPRNFLNNGSYFIGLALTTLEPLQVHFYEKDLFRISVSNSIRDVIVNEKTYFGEAPGVIKPNLKWECKKIK